MRKIIHRLRNQSEENRRHILHIIVFVVAAVLIALWIFSLGKNLNSSETQSKIKQDLKPFSVLKDSIIK